MNSRITPVFLFIEAVAISATVRLTLFFLNSSLRLRWMGRLVTSPDDLLEVPIEQIKMASLIQKAVTRVDRWVPWETACLSKALTAKVMLNRRNISTVLSVGFRKEKGGNLTGHAWLQIGPHFVFGFRHDIDTYVVNGRFS